MNLSNFEEYINRVIVERGYDYYLDDNVLEITEEDTNKYCIIVGGSNDYEVEIILDNKNKQPSTAYFYYNKLQLLSSN